MADKKFIMLSLEDSATKKIANVVSNDSCKKILEYLSDKDSTESEIAQALSIPLSTVHYNLQQLVDTGLVSSEEFHYSEKGKEVLHYKLANKYIIITPKPVSGIKEKLRKLLPGVFLAAGAGLVAQITANVLSPIDTMNSMGYAAPQAAMMKSAEMSSIAADSASGASLASAAGAHAGLGFPFGVFVWFFLGAIFGMAAYLLLTRKD